MRFSGKHFDSHLLSDRINFYICHRSLSNPRLAPGKITSRHACVSGITIEDNQVPDAFKKLIPLGAFKCIDRRQHIHDGRRARMQQ